MATCKKLTKTVKKLELVEVDEVVDDGVKLRLTQEELQYLRGVLGHVIHPKCSDSRKVLGRIYGEIAPHTDADWDFVYRTGARFT